MNDADSLHDYVASLNNPEPEPEGSSMWGRQSENPNDALCVRELVIKS